MPTADAVVAPISAHVFPWSHGISIPRRVPTNDRTVMRRAWAALIAGVCGIVAFGIYGQTAQTHALDQQVTQLTQQNAALQHRIDDAQRQIVEAQTAAWLEEQARKLGYVLPGEKVYVVASPGAAAPPAGGVDAPLPSFSPLPTPTPSPKPSTSPSAHPSPTAVPLTVGRTATPH